MPAHNDSFPWMSYYGNYRYFEDKMAQHRKVKSLEKAGEGLYSLTRTQGDTLSIFICECYAYGVLEYLHTVEQLGAKVDVVVINSAWCGYSPDAKKHCREAHVGLFRVGELMGALHQADYWNHLTESEEEYFKKQGWL